MVFEFSYDGSDDVGDEGIENQFHIRDSIIFLVDGSPRMFNSNQFSQCLETYKNIVSYKCSNNKKDRVGLFLFGTKDTNCDLDHVMELQNFDTVSVETLKKVMSIMKEGDEKYENMATDSNYSLFNAVSHAFTEAHKVRSNSKTRTIIVICTCNDNPLPDAPKERRRIEHLVSTFKDSDTELRVVGMSDSWNDNLFYKELQIISGTYSKDDYKQTYLSDLEGNILKPARIICSLPWKISPRVSVEVSVFNLNSKTSYPSKVKLSKGDNQILETRNVLREQNFGNDGYEMDGPEQRFITKDSVIYYKTYGGRDIHFKSEERQLMKTMGLEPSIEILAFKPISCDPLYHAKSANFITCSKTCSDESKAFFKALVSRCAAKKVMPMCKVVTKTKVIICMMIHSEDDGGFYMYKVPFMNSIRNLDNLLHHYLYDDEAQIPLKEDSVDIFSRLIDLAKVDFDLKSFKNPKLQKIIAHIEALALDENLDALPPDSTLPPPISGCLYGIVKEGLATVVGLSDVGSAKKRSNSKTIRSVDPKMPKMDLKEAAENGELQKYTVAQLKSFLKSEGISVAGTKSELIDKINTFYNVV